MKRIFSCFASHSSRDDEFITPLVKSLLSHGIHVWDDRLLRVSEDWEEIVEQKIRETHVFLLVITPNSYSSEPVLKEIELAQSYRKPIVPILLKQLNSWSDWAEYKIQDITHTNLTSWKSNQKLDSQMLETLVDGINKHRLDWLQGFTRRNPFDDNSEAVVAAIEDLVMKMGQDALPYLAQKLLTGTMSLFLPPESTAVIRAISAIGGDFARVILEFAWQAFDVNDKNIPTIIDALGYVGNGSTATLLNAKTAFYTLDRPELVQYARNAINRIQARRKYSDRPDIAPRDI